MLDVAAATDEVSLAPYPGDDLLLHGRRGLLVAVELHRVRGTTLRPRAQVGSVTEHLGEGDLGPDDLAVAPLLHAADATTAAVEVADDVAHVLLGRDDLDRHDGLEEDGLRPACGLLERHRAGDLERHLR